MNILVRLSPALVYGDKLGLVELLGDRVGLSVSDINEAVVAWLEYTHFNHPHDSADRDIVDTCFMGDPVGHDLLYAVADNRPEITAYIPDKTVSFSYARTHKDGFYLICEIPDANPVDLRFHSFPQSSYY